eukprot:g9226.t1
MALVESMDVAAEQEQHHQQATRSTGAAAAAPVGGALSTWNALAHQGQVEPQPGRDEEEQGHQHSPIQRVDTPCPAALRRHLHGGSRTQQGSFVLLPDQTECSRRFIPLEAGQTTVVGRSKSSGIRDHHVSRRHVEVTVPAEREEGSAEECCRIKYIGRNCRVVLVGGTLLKAEQEVPAAAGARVVLNYNNKGLPRYSYTLVPANSLPPTVTSAGRRSSGGGAMASRGRGTSANSRRWRGGESSPTQVAGGGDGSVGSQQQFHADPHPHAYNHLHRHSRHATLAAKQRQQQQQQQRQQRQRPAGGRFRKESQDKLQKERDEIFSKFADLKFV